MSSHNLHHRAQVKALVSQDQVINETELRKFHMNLEQALVTWERRGRIVRVITWIAISVLLADILAILVIEGIPALRGSEMARFVWATIGGVSLLIAAICLVWYRDKYRPAIQKTRFDLQVLMIGELQHQIEELRKELKSVRGS